MKKIEELINTVDFYVKSNKLKTQVIDEKNTDIGCLNTKGQIKAEDGSTLGGVVDFSSVIDYNNNISSYKWYMIYF
mgnify:CR=1 FL=1